MADIRRAARGQHLEDHLVLPPARPAKADRSGERALRRSLVPGTEGEAGAAIRPGRSGRRSGAAGRAPVRGRRDGSGGAQEALGALKPVREA